VTAVATVGDALTNINSMLYDVLLCDLNIEKPGDGFVVISAMRYAQPHCVSLVLTAYPSFENAMEAIQHQVDEFFTKPTDVNTLLTRIKEKLEVRRSRVPLAYKRLATVLRENCANIVAKVASAITFSRHSLAFFGGAQKRVSMTLPPSGAVSGGCVSFCVSFYFRRMLADAWPCLIVQSN